MSWSYVLFSLDGRINRQVYWLRFAVPYLICYGIAAFIDQMMIGNRTYAFPYLIILVVLVALWPSIAAAVKRLHDRNRSGWFLLFALVPIANIWIMIEIYFLKGTDGPNTYGPDPLAAGAAAPGPA